MLEPLYKNSRSDHFNICVFIEANSIRNRFFVQIQWPFFWSVLGLLCVIFWGNSEGSVPYLLSHLRQGGSQGRHHQNLHHKQVTIASSWTSQITFRLSPDSIVFSITIPPLPPLLISPSMAAEPDVHYLSFPHTAYKHCNPVTFSTRISELSRILAY